MGFFSRQKIDEAGVLAVRIEVYILCLTALVALYLLYGILISIRDEPYFHIAFLAPISFFTLFVGFWGSLKRNPLYLVTYVYLNVLYTVVGAIVVYAYAFWFLSLIVDYRPPFEGGNTNSTTSASSSEEEMSYTSYTGFILAVIVILGYAILMCILALQLYSVYNAWKMRALLITAPQPQQQQQQRYEVPMTNFTPSAGLSSTSSYGYRDNRPTSVALPPTDSSSTRAEPAMILTSAENDDAGDASLVK